MNKRKRIVAEHALSLFVEKGIAQTSIQDILKRANISKGTFYNYFTSKAECVSAILEQARYDATLMRSEFMIGKNPTNYEVLSEQIAMLSLISRTRGLDVMLEEILHSGDRELKKVVMSYRLHELDWLATRFEEVFQLPYYEQAFEAATIFYGMMQHILFLSKVIQQSTLRVRTVTDICLVYMQDIVRRILEDGTNLIDAQLLDVFLNSVRRVEVSASDVRERLAHFRELEDMTMPQQQITEALVTEVNGGCREVVVRALLQAFATEFSNSPHINEAKELASMLSYAIRQKQF